MQKNGSGETIKMVLSEQQITNKNKETNSMDEKNNTGNLITPNTHVKISEIGTQTSFPKDMFDSSANTKRRICGNS